MDEFDTLENGEPPRAEQALYGLIYSLYQVFKNYKHAHLHLHLQFHTQKKEPNQNIQHNSPESYQRRN